ncbi:MAG TPA: DUF4271 domain-containing protein [Chitinophagaceae bacterium]|nr:DUF4271 domain-containing protein [Chitinophagaceae bacterium]
MLYLFVSSCLAAQDSVVPARVTGADTLTSPDTSLSIYPVDTVSRRPLTLFSNSGRSLVDSLPLIYQLAETHPYYSFSIPAVSSNSDIRRFEGKELLFYVVTALVMVFGLLKLGFSKYFSDLFRVFFRTTLKQRQIREQLMQTPFPSLVFNGFFVASAGLYLTLLFQYFDITPIDNFWLLYLNCGIGLSVIYLVKFLGLIICGWLFNMRKAADSYIFIVFIINKVIGIALVPFIVLLAFSDGIMYNVALVLSWCTVGSLFLYRFILGFAAIRNEVRFNLFHFFLYLCAFEIAPLLLIYKLLLFVF